MNLKNIQTYSILFNANKVGKKESGIAQRYTDMIRDLGFRHTVLHKYSDLTSIRQFFATAG